MKQPVGLRARGKALWTEIMAALELDCHEAAILEEACRVADRLSTLDVKLRKEGLLMPDGRPHPALPESRHQQIALTRLIASLRLPADLAEVDARPQRRGASRGIYRRLHVVGA